MSAGDHVSKAAIRRQNGQINDDLSIVIVDMLPHGTTFPDVASQLTRSYSNVSTSPPKHIRKTSSLKTFFGCGSDPLVLEEFDPSFHDPSIRDRSTRGKTGDASQHCSVNIIADVDSYKEFSHLSPMSVSIKRQLWPTQHTQLPVAYQQAEQHSPSSDDSGSTTFLAEGYSMVTDPPAPVGVARGSQLPRASMDRGSAVSPLYRTSLDQITRTADLTTVLNRRSIGGQAPMGRRASWNNAPLERRNSSLGEGMTNMFRALSRGSIDSGQEHVSATHFGGPPTLVPVRGSQLPEKMIIDPTTHAEANFRKRSASDADNLYSTM